MSVFVCFSVQKKLPSIVNNWTVIDVFIFALTCDISRKRFPRRREFLSKMLIDGQEKQLQDT